MNDDRISRYLADQAEGISLAPADPEAVMRRGARRRTHRRTALVGSLAVVAVLATSVALRDGSDDQQVEVNYSAPEVAASAFDWSVVSPDSGLAWSRSSVQLGGTIYSLSTAPAGEDPTNGANPALPPAIYRSDDGAEWAQVSAPDGLRVSALAGSGDALFALGTAPAGGDTRELVVATSTDGAASWSNVTLPRDIAELEARHPGKIQIGTPKLVARDATHLVASIGVAASLDPMQYAAELREQDGAYTSEWIDEGLVIRDAGDLCQVVVDRDGEPDDMACTAEAVRGPKPTAGEVIATYTYDELGIDPELRDLIDGRSITYVSDDGATFERVDVPETAGEWTADLLATADGYRMVRGSYSGDVGVASVLSSADGRTWAVDTQLPGSPSTLGLLDGHVAVAVYEDDGNHVKVQQADGTWADLDLTSAVTVPEGQDAWTSDVAFGPLGLAAIVGVYDERGDQGTQYLVHSEDGSVLSVLPLEDLVEGSGSPIGATVTADAIAVRFSQPADDDPNTQPTQVVLVGTPTG